MIIIRDNSTHKEVYQTILNYIHSYSNNDIVWKFSPITLSNTNSHIIFSADNEVKCFSINDIHEQLLYNDVIYFLTHGHTKEELVKNISIVSSKDSLLPSLDISKPIMLCFGNRICGGIFGLDTDAHWINNNIVNTSGIKHHHGSWKDIIFKCSFRGIVNTIGKTWIFYNDTFSVDVFGENSILMNDLNITSDIPYDINDGIVVFHPEDKTKTSFLRLELPSGLYFRDDPLVYEYVLYKV